MRPVIDPIEATARLQQIFPRDAFDSVYANPLAGAAVAAMIYVDAVSGDKDDPASVTWARPSTCTWMSDDVLDHDLPAERLAWRDAAAKTAKKVEDLLLGWGLEFAPRYKDNSRETLRDETFKLWNDIGALRKRAGVATSSSRPRWALYSHFADLFDPSLTGAAFKKAVDGWQEAHMAPGPRLRVLHAKQKEDKEHAVTVTLPGSFDTRTLEPGIASMILKSVIEEWAPRRLAIPVVVSISEPGDKVFVGDSKILSKLGIDLDANNVLPDCVIADLGTDPVTFWIIEAVASDGPVTEGRKADLLSWAEDQSIPEGSCSFLTAFRSRNDAPARRRLKDLASGTWAYYADEPDHELGWYQLL